MGFLLGLKIWVVGDYTTLDILENSFMLRGIPKEKQSGFNGVRGILNTAQVERLDYPLVISYIENCDFP